MFNYFRKIMFNLRREPEPEIEQEPEKNEEKPPENSKDPSLNITKFLDINLDAIKKIFGGSGDIIYREFTFGNETRTRAGLIYIDGLVDKTLIDQNIIEPMMYFSRMVEGGELEKTFAGIESSLLSIGDVTKETKTSKLIDHVTSGDTVFIIDGYTDAFVISTRKWEHRSVSEPQTEVVVRGPREGFTETLRINTSLLRRKIKNPDLVLEQMVIGKRTKTDVCLAYIRGVTPDALLDEIRKRLKRIDTDAILESGYIEQYIEDAPFSIFPTVGNTEKPDVAAAKILEGRAAIIVDGTPFVLTVPMLFVESFQTAEDYYSRYLLATILRIIRYIAFFITVFAPSIYLSVLTYHPEMIPTPLLFTLAASEEGLPLPMFLEMFLMLVVFEILREAGVRLPRPVGQAVSIVGALVIGQAAVAAGIVSDFTVIVIAITAVSSFLVTSQTDSAVALRFICYFFSGLLGGVGIAFCILGIMIYLTTLRSFGVPYLSPLFPFMAGDQKDVIIRFPLWKMTNRPRSLDPSELRRQADNQKPEVSNE